MYEGCSDAGAAVRIGPPGAESKTIVVPAKRSAEGPGPEARSRTWVIRRCLLIGWDAAGWALALLMAAALRGELQVEGIDLGPLMNVIAIAIVAQLVIGGTLQTYRGRHCAGSVEDAINVTGATVLTGSTVFLIDFFAQPPLVPRSIPLLRHTDRGAAHGGQPGDRAVVPRAPSRPDRYTARRVLIYGTGPAAQHLLRMMMADPDGGYLPVALLDDDRRLRRRRINGVAVRGTRRDIAAAAAESRADMLVVADRSLPLGVLREVSAAADAAGLTVSMVPSLLELLQPLPPGLIPAPRTSTAPPTRPILRSTEEPRQPTRGRPRRRRRAGSSGCSTSCSA